MPCYGPRRNGGLPTLFPMCPFSSVLMACHETPSRYLPHRRRPAAALALATNVLRPQSLADMLACDRPAGCSGRIKQKWPEDFRSDLWFSPVTSRWSQWLQDLSVFAAVAMTSGAQTILSGARSAYGLPKSATKDRGISTILSRRGFRGPYFVNPEGATSGKPIHRLRQHSISLDISAAWR